MNKSIGREGSLASSIGTSKSKLDSITWQLRSYGPFMSETEERLSELHSTGVGLTNRM